MTKANMWRRIHEDDREARKLTFPNREEIAQWCGGTISEEAKASDPSDISIEFVVPNVSGNQRARLGNYIVKDSAGRFSVVKAADWLDKYEEVKPTKRDATFPVQRGSAKGDISTSNDDTKASGGIVVNMSRGNLDAGGVNRITSQFPNIRNRFFNQQ